MRKHMLLRLFNGRLADLRKDEQERFFIYAYKLSRHTRTLITFGIPVLFVIGGLREILVLSDADVSALLYRSGLVAALFLCAWLIQVRHAIRWRELAGIAWSLLCSAGLMLTTLNEPARLSLVHVVITLKCILLLPHAMRPLTALGMLLALVLPLATTLYLYHTPPNMWLVYLTFVLVGGMIGLIQRRVQLDNMLNIFQLRKRLFARLQTDSLTGILNREGWESHARYQITQPMVVANGYSVVFFDLDHFKHINDHQGHAMGDKILRNAARTMHSHMRPNQVLARFGGEEFVALLPGTDEAAAWQQAELIRQAIEHAPDNLIKLTTSAGVAQAHAGESLDSALIRADSAMLEAKRRGRNQVLCASDLEPADTLLQQARLELT